MTLTAGWENNKFVMLVQNPKGSILQRVSVTEDQWEKIVTASRRKKEITLPHDQMSLPNPQDPNEHT